MVEDAGKTYSEIRKRAEKRGAEATVRPGGVSVSYRGKTKTVRTHDELDAFLGARADSGSRWADVEWADVEWAADCMRERVDSATRRADAVDVERIVRRLMPKQSESDIAKVKSYVNGKMTRDGRPGEVDAVGFIREYFSDNPVRRRSDENDERADAKTGINDPNRPHAYLAPMNKTQLLARAQSEEYKRQIAAGKTPVEANRLAEAVRL